METWRNILGEKDPRIVTYPWMDSPIRPLLAVTAYLTFVLWLGPEWMRKKKPFELRFPMIVYNLAVTALSTWIFFKVALNGWFGNFNLLCEPVYKGEDPASLSVVEACWLFFMSKIVELIDTVFLVLRKKSNQISFLHVYHHATVPLTSWFGSLYGPGGYNSAFVLVNCFVHIWMYSYYGLAAMGPSVQKFLWWKKYLTTLQLIQFTIIAFYFTHLLLFAPTSCNTSKLLICSSLFQSIIFFGLFMHFYLKTYQTRPKSIRSSENNAIHEQAQGRQNANAPRKKKEF